MADTRAHDVLARQDELEAERREYESVWQEVADFCDPDGPDIHTHRSMRGFGSQPERSERRSVQVYDNTINSAANRLAAGLESLIIPQSDKWHNLSTEAMNDEETDEEKEWAEHLRDFLFTLRYSATSNFVPATQACLRNVVRYGPGYLYAEEGFGATMIHYASIPVVEAYIGRDRWGRVDLFHRKYERTARQCAQEFGDKLPASVKEMANDPAKCLTKLSLIQCIKPRDDRRTYRKGDATEYLDSAFVSYHVLEEEEAIVRESGFAAFPVACFNWRRYENDSYGISPTIEALTTVREINAVRRTGLRGLQQATDPALATKAELDYIPTLNPGAHYPGLIDESGRPMIALVQNPQMTATEALIRQEEKGALLGPSGSIIQAGFAANLERELAILEEKGIYEEGSQFLPPQSLAGRPIRPTFTSPLDILRRAAESRDSDMVVTSAVQYAQAAMDPSILDRIDGDEYLKIKKEASRAPQRLLRTDDEVEAIRQARAQAQQAQAGMAALKQGADIAATAVPAAAQAREAGMLPPGAMQAPATPPA
jgi:hypothetical protein